MREFVGAELIGIVFLRNVSLVADQLLARPEICTARALRGGAYSILPVVAVGEASAGPANHRRFDFSQRVHQILADALDVGDLRTFADPYTVVNHAAEIFGKMAVDIWRDGAEGFVEQDFDAGIR